MAAPLLKIELLPKGAIGSASQKRQRRDAAQPRAKTAERSEPWVGARKGKALKGRSRLLPRPFRALWIFHCQPRVSAAAQPPPWAMLPRAFSAWHFDSHFQLHPLPKRSLPALASAPPSAAAGRIETDPMESYCRFSMMDFRVFSKASGQHSWRTWSNAFCRICCHSPTSRYSRMHCSANFLGSSATSS
jgi:hypothetical protein